MVSLSTFHPGVLRWAAILFYLFKPLCTHLFEQLINISQFIEMWMFVRVCVSAYVFASFNQIKVALCMYCHSLFHTPFNNLNSIHYCLLRNNPGKLFRLVINNENLIYETVNTYIVMHTVYNMCTCV